MKDKEITSETLKSIFNSIIKTRLDSGMLLMEALKPFIKERVLTTAIKQTNPEKFYFALLYELNLATESLIHSSISEDDDIKFIFMNFNYIEDNYNFLIRNEEGMACCADKSRTIVSALVRHFISKKEIKFNWDQEYTYHLPEKIFKDHQMIIDFYQALKFMFYGNNNRYLNFFKEYPNIIKEQAK